MIFEDALNYIISKGMSASYIASNSSISRSTARRLLRSNEEPFTAQIETQTALVEFVKDYHQSSKNNNINAYLDRLEMEVDEHFSELMKRPLFRKNIHIEALKLFIKAQSADGNTINLDVLNEVIDSGN